MWKVKVKVQITLYKYGKNAPRISRQYSHEGGKFVTLRHRPNLQPGDTPGTHLLVAESNPGP